MNIGNISVYAHILDELKVGGAPRSSPSTASTPHRRTSVSDPICLLHCGETAKYFTVSEDKKEPRRLYVNKCADSISKVIPEATLREFAEFALRGGNAALFSLASGLRHLPSAQRMRTLLDMLNHLEAQIGQGQREFRISYLVLGLTDRRCVNLLNEEIIPLISTPVMISSI
ncbi:hypothetical protein BJ085DRAFT_29757 [Dimargaris cristalligena]|uniref:Uncharacterized protein n=1 Tax=Dimargaris cristalligena TaxID=215637 RepID=A0A4V1J532_9FUNG|nr:hypothetical protein BJ085DRAFT_29757 [Dimargaris cristalligena]|eukprot:RKP37649.1 hypothetical protein BJ085DRAFT_29757 [Dimargaris cristalligena]